MSNNIINSFETQWSTEAEIQFQREGSLLKTTVDNVKVMGASTYKFHTAGTFTSVKNKPRHAELISNNTDHGTVEAILNNFHSSDYVDSLDMIKNNIDVRKIYTNGITYALGREMDEEILDAIAAEANLAANTTNSNSAAAASVDLFAEALAILKSNDSFRPGNTTLIITPGVERKLLAVSGLTSGDFISEAPTQNGVRKRLMGMDIIVHSSDTLISGNTHTCYAYSKEAVGLAIGQDISIKSNYVADKDSWIISGSCSFGAVAKKANGIARLIVTV